MSQTKSKYKIRKAERAHGAPMKSRSPEQQPWWRSLCPDALPPAPVYFERWGSGRDVWEKPAVTRLPIS